MALDKHERLVQIFNLANESVPVQAPELEFSKVIQILSDMYESESAYLAIGETEDAEEFEPQDFYIFIADMEYSLDEQYITILVNYGDPEAADPGFINEATKSVRIARPRRNETIGYSAHLVFRTSPRTDDPFQHRAVLERVPRLGRSRILSFFSRLLREFCKADGTFFFADPATQKSRRYYPKIQWLPQISHVLEQDIKDGRVSGVDLIKKRFDDTVFDDDPVIHRKSITLSLGFNEPLSGNALLGRFPGLRKMAADDGYDEIQLHFRKEDTDQSLSPRFRVDIEDAKDLLYTRLVPIGDFEHPLDQCTSRINDEVQTRLIEVLQDEQYWR